MDFKTRGNALSEILTNQMPIWFAHGCLKATRSGFVDLITAVLTKKVWHGRQAYKEIESCKDVNKAE